MSHSGKVLIVDDVPENLGMLFEFLAIHAYEVLVAEGGDDALEIALHQQPDVILLDVMMPDIDGFEVCRRLKNDPRTQAIPIIFMTALTETENRLEGFKVGGVDYVSKPFQQQEVLARVRSHMALYRLQRSLQEKNQQLDAFAHTAAHDLKSPLHIIYSLGQGSYDNYREKLKPEDRRDFSRLLELTLKSSDIVDSLLLLASTSKTQELHLDSVDMGMVFGKAEKRLHEMLDIYQAELLKPEKWVFIIGYPGWLEEVWVNLLTNALKYGGQPPRVEVGFDLEENQARFWIKDNGPGLTPEQQGKLFTPFTRLHQVQTGGHGLGLSIVQRIVTRLGGQVGVESGGQGSLFSFTLPAA